jgi:hypothetical protein
VLFNSWTIIVFLLLVFLGYWLRAINLR